MDEPTAVVEPAAVVGDGADPDPATAATIAAPPALVLVAAVADNGVIGRDNRLPWHLPADLAHFRRLTLDRPILMGRRTWESLPGPLARRRHLVLSRDPDFRAAGATVVPSLDAALAAAGSVAELMVIGGASLYAAALPLARRLQLTLVHAEIPGDVRFPPWDPADWRELARATHPVDDRHAFAMTFLTLERRV